MNSVVTAAVVGCPAARARPPMRKPGQVCGVVAVEGRVFSEYPRGCRRATAARRRDIAPLCLNGPKSDGKVLYTHFIPYSHTIDDMALPCFETHFH